MLAGLAFVLRHGYTVFSILGAIVLAVEALATAAQADGREKRELALERAREEFAELGIEIPDGLLAALVNVTVWLFNRLTGGGWSADAEDAAVAIEATATAASSPAGRRSLEDIEAQARAEFDAIAARRRQRSEAAASGVEP